MPPHVVAFHARSGLSKEHRHAADRDAACHQLALATIVQLEGNASARLVVESALIKMRAL